jgi:di/tricarboxylate transporter
MTADIALVMGLLLATVVLFASGRMRMDVIAVLLIIALMLTGLLSPGQALGGFGDPLVILIAGLFVVGEGLFRTGVAFSVGNWLMGVAGTSETRLLILLMIVVAGLSAFMSNTGAVAIFIPVAMNLAIKAGVPAHRLLMPLAYAGSIGGMMTLIGTPPNLAVSTELTRAGFEPFNFFSFTPIALLVLIVAILYMRFIGPRLLPDGPDANGAELERPSLRDMVESYGISRSSHLLRLGDQSVLVGSTLGESLLRTRFGVTVIGLAREEGGKRLLMPTLIQTEYRAGDVLLMVGEEADVDSMIAELGHFERVPIEEQHRTIVAHELGVVEVLLPPRSRLVGQTIREARFREDYGLSVLGVLRKGQPLQEKQLLDTRLDFGDSLLVGGGWRQIDAMQRKQGDFAVLTLPREVDEVAPYRERSSWALGIVAAMLVVMTFGLVPSVTAVLMAGTAMVLARCVTMEEAYRAINWQSVVLIAGMLPMATALQQTGALDLIVSTMVSTLGGYGPMAMMAGLFLFTTVFSQFISNTATAVLVAPVALGAAQGMGVAPYPMLMIVAIAASTAFATPMASPVNTLVMGPGQYKFGDFVRMGVPLQVLVMIIALVCVPVFFPL